MTTASFPVAHTPPPRRLNVRLIVFLLVIGGLFGGIGYIMVQNALSGGIIDRGSFKDVDLKALGNFPFDKIGGTLDNVPQRFRDLDGQKVRLSGYMFAPQVAGNHGSRFEFVYNVQQCCFLGPPQVQERVYGHAKSDVPIYDQSVFVEIFGTLHVRTIRSKESNEVVSLYDMDVDHVKELH